jgi:hypothetical protein
VCFCLSKKDTKSIMSFTSDDEDTETEEEFFWTSNTARPTTRHLSQHCTRRTDKTPMIRMSPMSRNLPLCRTCCRKRNDDDSDSESLGDEDTEEEEIV